MNKSIVIERTEVIPATEERRKSLNLEELFKDLKIIMLEPNFSKLLEDFRWIIKSSNRDACAKLFAMNTEFKNITDIINGLGASEFAGLVNFIIFCLALSQRLQEMEDESLAAGANDDEMVTTRDVLLAAEVIESWLALPENRDLPEDNKYRTVQRKLVDSVRSQLALRDASRNR